MVYASGQPFSGWHVPTEETLHFLTAPWPRYITLNDLLFNVGGYVPLGFLLTVSLRPRLRSQRAVFYAILIGTALSIAMEYMQTMLPGRVASNVDVLTNALGSALGALAAPLFAPTRHMGRRLVALRRRWFAPGWSADAGLVLICLWLLTPLHPTAQFLGTGDLRTALDLQPWFLYTPGVALAVEAGVACFNLVGLGLLATALMQPQAPWGRLIAITLAAAVLLKASTAAAFKTLPAWAWLTPGVTIGLVLGAAALYGLMWLPGRVRALLAAPLILVATAVINISPPNPYQTVPPQLLSGTLTHFLSFSGIVQALSAIWPFLALAYLVGIAVHPVQRVKS